MSNFRKDGRQFHIAPSGAGWTWSVRNLDGDLEAEGVAPTKAVAAAGVVGATLAMVDWPEETGMTSRARPALASGT